MKLSKIYSNVTKFREIEFADGLNVIIGKIIDNSNLKSNSHNLGKSTLIELIDFMLLKELKKGSFLKDNYKKFIKHVFYLELKKSDGRYLTIKRDIENNTKVSIKLHNEGKQDYRNERVWDYNDLPLTSQDKSRNPKEILDHLIGFNQIFNYSYRTYLNYFLRTQYDYDKVFKLSKFKGSDSNWKSPLAYLLGFNGDLIKSKYDLEAKIVAEEKLLEEMEKELKITLSDLNRIEALIDVKQRKKDEVQSKIDNFDFYLKERELNRDLIENTEKEISVYNTQEYKIKYEIDKAVESITKQVKFDLTSIELLFKEINLYFPDNLKKSYQELIKFNMDITEERNKYLTETLQKNQDELINVRNKLQVFNNNRNETLSVLQEKDSFVKFKKYQMEIVEIESEISSLLSKIDNIEVLRAKEKSINQLIKQVENLVTTIILHLKEANDLFKKIQTYFSDLVKIVLDETAILFYSLNSNNNIEFEAKITSIKEEILTSKSEGYSYRKMLCVCFDLSIILAYKDVNEFFKFVYHDGSLESLSNTKKITYIETVRKICKDNNIQYIFTTLEDDIPLMPDGTNFKLTNDEIVIVLDDRDNDEGRLFGISF